MIKDKHIQEWIKQSDYDFKTAQAMFQAKRYIYCVFMCHLSVEKMLKGSYSNRLNRIPPKVHSLVYLAQSQKLDLSEDMRSFLEELDEVSVPTRYPDELKKLLTVYDQKRTQNILNNVKKALKCLKPKLKKP